MRRSPNSAHRRLRARWEHAAARLGATAAVIVFGAGCMQTGREWVHAPFTTSEGPGSTRQTPGDDLPWSQPSTPAPRGGNARLAQTVTLGESYLPTQGSAARATVVSSSATAAAPPHAFGAPYAAGATVHLAPAYPFRGAYGAYGAYGAHGWSAAPHQVTPGSRPSHAPGMQPGQDWERPPSYGPRFPFTTAPASPWR